MTNIVTIAKNKIKFTCIDLLFSLKQLHEETSIFQSKHITFALNHQMMNDSSREEIN